MMISARIISALFLFIYYHTIYVWNKIRIKKGFCVYCQRQQPMYQYIERYKTMLTGIVAMTLLTVANRIDNALHGHKERLAEFHKLFIDEPIPSIMTVKGVRLKLSGC